MANTGYTQLEKFLGMTNKDFQNENEDGLDYMAYFAQTYNWVEKYADLIMGHKDFHDNYKYLVDAVRIAEAIDFNEDDLQNMLLNNIDAERMCEYLSDEVRAIFYADVSEEIGQSRFYAHVHEMCSDSINSVFSGMLYNFKDENFTLTIENELKEENAVFTNEQSEMISSICDNISGEVVQYCNQFGQEHFENFMQACFNCFASIKVFSSQYSPEQMEAMSKCIFTYLGKTEPDNLNSDSVVENMESICSNFKKHQKAYYLTDFIIDNMDKYIAGDCRDLQPWVIIIPDFVESICDKFIEGENFSAGLFFYDIFGRFGFMDNEIESIISKVISNNILTEEEMDFDKFATFYSFLLDGKDVNSALNLCNIMYQFEHPFDYPLSLYCRYRSLGLSDDFLKDMFSHDCSLMGYDEIYIAYKNGLSKSEIDRCYDSSAIKICQNRLAIQKDKELEQKQERPSAIQKMKEKEDISKTQKIRHKNQLEKDNGISKD